MSNDGERGREREREGERDRERDRDLERERESLCIDNSSRIKEGVRRSMYVCVGRFLVPNTQTATFIYDSRFLIFLVF